MKKNIIISGIGLFFMLCNIWGFALLAHISPRWMELPSVFSAVVIGIIILVTTIYLIEDNPDQESTNE